MHNQWDKTKKKLISIHLGQKLNTSILREKNFEKEKIYKDKN